MKRLGIVLGLLLVSALARAEIIVLTNATSTDVDGRTGPLCAASPCAGRVDLSGFKKVSIRFRSPSGGATGVCEIWQRHDPSDEWTKVKSYNDPTTAGKLFVGFPDGEVAVYVTVSNGTITTTLKRTK